PECTMQKMDRLCRNLNMMANYSNAIKESLKGKKIRISYFLIPTDNKSYVLSKNVYSHCFFCSISAGIETIMGIQFKNKQPRLKTDDYITLEGIFYFNDKNKDDWTFSIQNAVVTNKK